MKNINIEYNFEMGFVNRRVNKLYIARNKRGLTQAQTAILAKTTQPTYSRIESGVTAYPDPVIMRRLATIFKIDVKRLRETARI